MDIPEKMVTAIESLYKNPQFNVKVDGTTSDWYKQETGIRQGCPLSPYLFIIVMTVMFKDVHNGLNMERGKIEGLDFTELLYADDTAVVTNNTNAMNRILAKIEKCAEYFGLKFNKTKCVAMNYNTTGTTKYADNTKVPVEAETIYLGATISKTHNTKKEIANKISQCMVILKKWTTSGTTRSATINSKHKCLMRLFVRNLSTVWKAWNSHKA